MEPAATVPAVPPSASAVRRIGAQRDILGECPLWDERRQCLWWIDIRAPALRCLYETSGEVESWVLPELVGSIALTTDDRLLVALGCRLALFAPRTGHWQTLAQLHFDEPDMRFNDGRCDRQGRFWFGTMNNITRGPVGRLYRFDAAQGLIDVAQGLCIPNSLAWSPDGRTMYFADSLRHAVEAFDYDPVARPAGSPRASRPHGRRPFRTEPRWTPRATCGSRSSRPRAWCATHPTAASTA
jgi:sugar lactone lactonase YvrE